MRPHLLIALLSFSVAAQASEPDLFGFGARSSAMAGTGAADSESYESSYVNPAGLVDPTRRRLTLSYVGAFYHVRMDGVRRAVQDTEAMVFGAVLPLPFGGVLKDRLALGVGFYFPFGVINRARAPFPNETRLVLLDDRTQVVSVTGALGVRLHARVTFGIGILALAALSGQIVLRPDASGSITTVSEEQLVVSYAPVIGLRVVANRWLRLGLVFRGESKSSYDIEIKNSLGGALPVEIPTLRLAGTAQYDPLQMTLESSMRCKFAVFNVALNWKHWSPFPQPTLNATLGAPPLPDPNFHDTVVPRLGIEIAQQASQFQIIERLGYFFEWSPAPGGSDRVLLDGNRHAVTAGFGIEWKSRLTTLQSDLFIQWHHLTGARTGGDLAALGLSVGIDL